MVPKAVNYTDEQVKRMIAVYPETPTRDTVDALAEEFGKSPRSIIAKLSGLGIYQAPKRVTKTGDPIVKKEELVAIISKYLEVDVPSLLKTNKQDLQKMVGACQEWFGQQE